MVLGLLTRRQAVQDGLEICHSRVMGLCRRFVVRIVLMVGLGFG